MLPRNTRLAKDWLINKVRRRGRRVSGRLSVVFFLPARSRSSASRCAIIVSKQISKLAVERNLAKRRFSEALKEIWPKLKPGFCLVFSLSSRCRGVAYHLIYRDLVSLFNKAGLIKTS